MTQTPTILIVDDEPLNILTLKAILEKNGFAVLTADDGPAGRQLALEAQPDMILLDVMMPEESGFQTMLRLKENPDTNAIPVIFLTCLADVSHKINGLNLGAVDYVTKPFHAREVVARINSHLKSQRTSRAIINEQAGRLNQIGQAQRAMLVEPDALPEAGFGVHYLPVLEAGGDFYDVFKLSDNRFGYFVADVSGHDLGASFITSSLKVLVRQNAGPSTPPEKALIEMNKVLGAVMQEGMYLTACYAVLDRKAAMLEVACAGHLPTLFMPKGGQPEPLNRPGDILGVFTDVTIEGISRRVDPGDRVFLYSDGLVERVIGPATMPRSRGMEQLSRECAATRGLPIDQAVARVAETLCPPSSAPTDDVLLLGFEV